MSVPEGDRPEVPRHRSGGALLAERRLERLGRPFLRWIAYRDANDPAGSFELRPLGGADVVLVGRSADSDVSLPWDARVSGVHCRLLRLGGRWMLEDDGLSRNGTFLDGRRVSRRERLFDGAQVRCGRTIIVFCDPVSPAKAATRTDDEEAGVVLTATQRRVLVALCRPYLELREQASPATNVAIAAELFLSVDTVKGYVRELVKAFGLGHLAQGQKRAALAHVAVRHGIVTPHDLRGER